MNSDDQDEPDEPDEQSVPSEDREPDADATATEEPPVPRTFVLSERIHLVVGLFAPMIVMIVNLWRLRFYTVDDAYISFRYARNLARGWGLVFNEGEAIEGYTNFGWTVILAAGYKAGLDPDVLSKVLGGAAACGSLAVCYVLSRRIAPLRTAPCVSTWLLASAFPTLGYAVFGLETSFFVFLVLAGLLALFREGEQPTKFPWSGVLFGLAGLTRPEAPMFLGIAMLLLGRRFVGRQNLIRGAVFVAIVGAHILWRKSFYGQWLPNTFAAKTGNLDAQFHSGVGYILGYIAEGGPAIYFFFAGVAVAVIRRQKEMLTMVALALAVCGYIMLVGGDWMPHFRFMAMFEPFAFVVAGVAVRAIVDSQQRAAQIAMVLFALYAGIDRQVAFEDARQHMRKEDAFWESAVNQSAQWLLERGRPGYVAVADMGYIGYHTDYPILDLLGLIDPVISQLPGGYTQKTGKGYVDRVFDVMPTYFVLVGGKTCSKLSFGAQRKLKKHPQFRRHYHLAKLIEHSKGGAWCIFEKNE